MGTQPAIFKWRQTEPGLILCAVRWYLRYSLSLRNVEELLEERGLNVDHTTVWRWVQYYGPELEQRLRRYLKPTNKSWRVDETYVRVKGRWCSGPGIFALPAPGFDVVDIEEALFCVHPAKHATKSGRLQHFVANRPRRGRRGLGYGHAGWISRRETNRSDRQNCLQEFRYDGVGRD